MKQRSHTSTNTLKPVTFRLPKTGTVDSYFGGARPFWNDRILPSAKNNFKPEVRSISVKQPGAKRGIRFILFESAKQYFDTLAENQAA